ncbi:DsbA family protein [Streptacidiphilus pinicola]|uniref:DsbA family protein n=1 Tax=Streptacidiphilus pinicola TaxID=2219663 RepID=A0A2X0K8M0_9ACTN|nr:thioredoxin domain-containing protein [Streptacidiphilus pinicola]RAG85635.1 DsbA family protein [Streptacidiphilus pinicola]
MTSNKNQRPQQPGDARERLRNARVAEQDRKQRLRRVGIAASVAAAIAVVAVGAVVVSNLGGSGSSGSGGGTVSADKAAKQQLVVPAHVSSSDNTVIVYGDPNAKHTLDVYEDFRCPICDKLEKTDGPTIQQLADNGTYKIQYHLATFLDDNLGGTGSMDALEVAAAALNEGGPAMFKAFHDVLYANQPAETTDGFGNLNHLLDLAKKVPGLVTPQFTKEVQDRVFAPWAQKVTDAFNASGVQGTPTLKLDGKAVNVFDNQGNPITPAQYTALIQQTAGAK